MNQAASRRKSDPEKPKSWPRFVLRVDHEMCTYLTSGKKTKLGLLSSSLKVWILLKIARGFSRGAFELLPYSEKENDEKETASESPQKEGSPKLSVFPIKKWMSRAKRAKWTSCKGNSFTGVPPSWPFADYNKRRIKKRLLHLIREDPGQVSDIQMVSWPTYAYSFFF